MTACRSAASVFLLSAFLCSGAGGCAARPGASQKTTTPQPVAAPLRADQAHGPAAPADPRQSGIPANPWSDLARDILAQHCGACHRRDLPTAVPRALAVFDLLDDPWWGRLQAEQFDGILQRLRAVHGLPLSDEQAMISFVGCARDGLCEVNQTERPMTDKDQVK